MSTQKKEKQEKTFSDEISPAKRKKMQNLEKWRRNEVKLGARVLTALYSGCRKCEHLGICGDGHHFVCTEDGEDNLHFLRRIVDCESWEEEKE